MEQLTDAELRNEYVKAVYCHLAYLTSIQSTSCKIPGWMTHKLESRLPGDYQRPQICRWYHSNGRKQRGTKEPLDERREWKDWLKTQHSKYEDQSIQFHWSEMNLLSHARLFETPWTIACTKLLHPWDFLGKGTGVGCCFLCQGIFLTQGWNPDLPHCRQMFYRLSHQEVFQSHYFMANRWGNNGNCDRLYFGGL